MEFEYEYKKYRKLNFNSRFKEKEYDKHFYKLLNEYISRLSYELSLSSDQIDELVDKILENVDYINYTDDLDMYVLGDFDVDQKTINLNRKLLNNNSKYSLFYTLCRELTHAQGYDNKTNSFGMYKSNQNEVDYEGTGLDELITEMISMLVTTDFDYLMDENKNVTINSVYSQLLFIGDIIASVLGVSKKYLLKVAYNKREVFDEVMSNRFLSKEVYERFILEISLCVSTIKNILEDIDLNVEDRNKNLILSFENLSNIANIFLVERSKMDIKSDPYQDLGEYIESIQFDYINIIYKLKLASHSFGISYKDLKINKFLKDDYIDRVNYLLTLFSYEQTKNVYEYNISNYYSDEYTGSKLKELANEKFGMEYIGKKLPIELDLSMQDMEEIVIPEKIKVYKDPYLDSYILRNFYDKNISDIAKSKFSEKMNVNAEKIKNMYRSLKERFGFIDDEQLMSLPEHVEQDYESEDEEYDKDYDEAEEIPYDITSYINLVDDKIENNVSKGSDVKNDIEKTMAVPIINKDIVESIEENDETKSNDNNDEIKESKIEKANTDKLSKINKKGKNINDELEDIVRELNNDEKNSLDENDKNNEEENNAESMIPIEADIESENIQLDSTINKEEINEDINNSKTVEEGNEIQEEKDEVKPRRKRKGAM